MVIVLTGPMGCGKTTIGKLLAAHLGSRFEDGDDFHPKENISKMKAGRPLGDEDRYPWLEILHDMIWRGVADGEDIVLACSALKRKYREILRIDQQNVVSVYLKGDADLLQKRVAARTDHYMNKGLLESQLNTLEVPESGLIVDIADSPKNIVEKILVWISENYEKGK